jgi:hypothetical protein
MPAQEPVVSSISMSKFVRCSNRCASSRRPARLNSSSRCLRSAFIWSIAFCIVGLGVT